jgi:succinate dehydrogenase / fumarate reductase flavoprotein subunit
MWTNQNLSFARALRDMIVQAEAILKAAVARNESRGAHYKPEFPERNDAEYLKTTLAVYDPSDGSSRIELGAVDTSLIPPRARTYGKKDAGPAKTAAAVPAASSAGEPAAST